MKRLFLMVLLCSIPIFLSGQNNYDNDLKTFIFDRFGNDYRISDIAVPPSDDPHPCSFNNAIFNIYFYISTDGGIVNANYLNETQMDILYPGHQELVCRVISDLGASVISASSPKACENEKVNLKIVYRSLTTTSSSYTAGSASSFYGDTFTSIESEPYVLPGYVWQQINTGTIPYEIGAYAAEVFHGVISINNDSNVLPGFYTGLDPAGIVSQPMNAYNHAIDLYHTFLHETLHTMGIASFLEPGDGCSVNPKILTSIDGEGELHWITIWDEYLMSNGNNLVITNQSLCNHFEVNADCNDISNNPNLSFSGNYINSLDLNNNTLSSTVYAPNGFLTGSSLSHLENPNFLMSPTIIVNTEGLRAPLQEEFNILCALGYSISSTYGNNLSFDDFNYSTSINVTPCTSEIPLAGDDYFNDDCDGSWVIESCNPIHINFSDLTANDPRAVAYDESQGLDFCYEINCDATVFIDNIVGGPDGGFDLIVDWENTGVSDVLIIQLKYAPIYETADGFEYGPFADVHILAHKCLDECACESYDECNLICNSSLTYEGDIPVLPLSMHYGASCSESPNDQVCGWSLRNGSSQYFQAFNQTGLEDEYSFYGDGVLALGVLEPEPIDELTEYKSESFETRADLQNSEKYIISTTCKSGDYFSTDPEFLPPVSKLKMIAYKSEDYDEFWIEQPFYFQFSDNLVNLPSEYQVLLEIENLEYQTWYHGYSCFTSDNDYDKILIYSVSEISEFRYVGIDRLDVYRDEFPEELENLNTCPNSTLPIVSLGMNCPPEFITYNWFYYDEFDNQVILASDNSGLINLEDYSGQIFDGIEIFVRREFEILGQVSVPYTDNCSLGQELSFFIEFDDDCCVNNSELVWVNESNFICDGLSEPLNICLELNNGDFNYDNVELVLPLEASIGTSPNCFNYPVQGSGGCGLQDVSEEINISWNVCNSNDQSISINVNYVLIPQSPVQLTAAEFDCLSIEENLVVNHECVSDLIIDLAQPSCDFTTSNISYQLNETFFGNITPNETLYQVLTDCWGQSFNLIDNTFGFGVDCPPVSLSSVLNDNGFGATLPNQINSCGGGNVQGLFILLDNPFDIPLNFTLSQPNDITFNQVFISTNFVFDPPVTIISGVFQVPVNNGCEADDTPLDLVVNCPNNTLSVQIPMVVYPQDFTAQISSYGNCEGSSPLVDLIAVDGTVCNTYEVGEGGGLCPDEQITFNQPYSIFNPFYTFCGEPKFYNYLPDFTNVENCESEVCCPVIEDQTFSVELCSDQSLVFPLPPIGLTEDVTFITESNANGDEISYNPDNNLVTLIAINKTCEPRNDQLVVDLVCDGGIIAQLTFLYTVYPSAEDFDIIINYPTCDQHSASYSIIIGENVCENKEPLTTTGPCPDGAIEIIETFVETDFINPLCNNILGLEGTNQLPLNVDPLQLPTFCSGDCCPDAIGVYYIEGHFADYPNFPSDYNLLTGENEQLCGAEDLSICVEFTIPDGTSLNDVTVEYNGNVQTTVTTPAGNGLCFLVNNFIAPDDCFTPNQLEALVEVHCGGIILTQESVKFEIYPPLPTLEIVRVPDCFCEQGSVVFINPITKEECGEPIPAGTNGDYGCPNVLPNFNDLELENPLKECYDLEYFTVADIANTELLDELTCGDQSLCECTVDDTEPIDPAELQQWDIQACNQGIDWDISYNTIIDYVVSEISSVVPGSFIDFEHYNGTVVNYYEVVWTPEQNPWDKKDCPVFVNNVIKIASGTKLNIHGMAFEFGTRGKIVVEEGAYLLINGASLKTASNCMWQGIRVEGDSSYPSKSTTFQRGFLEFNNSSIHDAIIGIANFSNITENFAPSLDIELVDDFIVDTDPSTNYEDKAYKYQFKFPEPSEISNHNTGGELRITGGRFYNCFYGIANMYYTPENPNLFGNFYLTTGRFYHTEKLKHPLNCIDYSQGEYIAKGEMLYRNQISIYEGLNIGCEITDVNSFKWFSDGFFENNIVGVSMSDSESPTSYFSSNVYNDNLIAMHLRGNGFVGVYEDNVTNTADPFEDGTPTFGIINESARVCVQESDFINVSYGITLAETALNESSINYHCNFDAPDLDFSRGLWSLGNNVALNLNCNTFQNLSEGIVAADYTTQAGVEAGVFLQGDCVGEPVYNTFANNTAFQDVVDLIGTSNYGYSTYDVSISGSTSHIPNNPLASEICSGVQSLDDECTEECVNPLSFSCCIDEPGSGGSKCNISNQYINTFDNYFRSRLLIQKVRCLWDNELYAQAFETINNVESNTSNKFLVQHYMREGNYNAARKALAKVQYESMEDWRFRRYYSILIGQLKKGKTMQDLKGKAKFILKFIAKGNSYTANKAKVDVSAIDGTWMPIVLPSSGTPVFKNQEDSSIENLLENPKPIQLYPNPVEDVLTIDMEGAARQAYVLNVYDALGRLVLQQGLFGNSIEQFDVSALADGLYYVNIVNLNNGQTIHYEKLMVK